MATSKKTATKAKKLGKREPEVDLETKPILKKHKEKSEEKETMEGFADSLQQIKRRVELLETKSDQSNLISVKETVEGLDEIDSNSVENVSVRTKTLLVSNLSPLTRISDIINFFKDVGEVFRVRLILNYRGSKHVGCGFVEFASAKETKKALKKKNGEIFLGNEINLDVAKDPLRHKYIIDHKVWDEDYLRRENLLIEKDETVKGVVEERKTTLFVANISPQTKISHIYNFFDCVGEVVSVRLIVNHEGKHVGYAFVEFASANEAKEALEYNGEYLHDHKIFLQLVERPPYPPRPKYSLAEMLCYQDYLRRESLLIETVEGLDEPNPDFVEAVAVRKKTLRVFHLSYRTKISDIINFFKDVGEVVHVRIIVNHTASHVGCGFVEFASANEANKALQKNGEILLGHKIILGVAVIAPYPPPKYCIDHKVWYEDYLRRESLPIEGDEIDEPDPVFVEEVSVRKKTLFVTNLSPETNISHVNSFLNCVGEVVSVRLIVNHEGKHVGCGFVEFASAKEAKKALMKKNGQCWRGHKIFLQFSKIAPYPPRSKYNLAEMLWYEDYLRRESLLIEEKDDLEIKPKMIGFCGTKTTFDGED